MTTSNKITKRIERYIEGKMSELERWKFELDLLLDPGLNKLFKEQLFVLRLVRHFHRNELKKSFDKIYFDLYNDLKNPEFRNKINSIF